MVSLYDMKKKHGKLLLDLLSILLGTAIFTFGMYNIHARSLITEGGVFGMVLLLGHWFHIPPSISSLILDGSFYLLGFKFLGKRFLKYSILASICVAGWYALYGRFAPILPDLSSVPLAAAILGGCFVGVGVGLVVRVGAASGGDDALALVLAHMTKRSISFAYLFSDLVVLLLSLTYIPFTHIFYSLITVTISSFLIGRLEYTGGHRKQTAENEA